MATTAPRSRRTAKSGPAEPPDEALLDDEPTAAETGDPAPATDDDPLAELGKDTADDEPAEVVTGEIIDESPEDEMLLDLKTVPDRPMIRIDGEPYELAVKNDFGIEEQHRLAAFGRRFDELFKRNKLTDKERGNLKILLDYMFERALRAPDEIKKKLGDEQRSQVVLAFTYAPLAKAVALMQAAQQTGEQVNGQTARDSSTSES